MARRPSDEGVPPWSRKAILEAELRETKRLCNVAEKDVARRDEVAERQGLHRVEMQERLRAVQEGKVAISAADREALYNENVRLDNEAGAHIRERAKRTDPPALERFAARQEINRLQQILVSRTPLDPDRYREFYNQHLLPKLTTAATATRFCLHCGREFAPQDPRQRFCEDKCAATARKDRERQRRKDRPARPIKELSAERTAAVDEMRQHVRECAHIPPCKMDELCPEGRRLWQRVQASERSFNAAEAATTGDLAARGKRSKGHLTGDYTLDEDSSSTNGNDGEPGGER